MFCVSGGNNALALLAVVGSLHEDKIWELIIDSIGYLCKLSSTLPLFSTQTAPTWYLWVINDKKDMNFRVDTQDQRNIAK